LLADVVTDWNERACAIVGKLGPGAPGHRAMAFVQVAVFEAVNSIDPRYTPYMQRIPVSPGASVDAAVAAANRAVLLAMVPADKAAIESAYQDAVAKIPEGQAKADGIAVGEKAGALMVTRAAADGAIGPDNYAWQAQPGRYVPTMIPAVTTWPRRAPWIMDKTSQFRPGPPPALDSEMWEKDFHEVKALGGKTSATRTPEQTAIAQFWEETRPLVYYPVLKSVAMMPGRTVTQNARLYAAAGMAMDDALIAVFDAKYHYNFWRPVTAARMEHTAGKTKVAADLGWTPFISTPMHPEYPCAHCVVSGSMGAVLQAELGSTPAPVMSAASPTANGATREWKTVPAFMEEVKMARIYDGVHYRNSTVVGNDIGMKVGDLVQKRFASPARY
jgi:hypothetical protein